MTGNNIAYFKFKRDLEEWVLPVYKDSVMYSDPNHSFWDKSVVFVSEVSKSEYEQQFKTKIELKQLEFDF